MASEFQHPQHALDWLYSTQRLGVKLGLKNMQRLLAALHLPMDSQRLIHVAGTNGKGSTCAFIHALLTATVGSSGLFTSPHLVRFNERIRDSEREITDDEISVGLSKLRHLVSDWDPHPTFFELTLALALDWFRHRQLSWIVVETGLGGRLDATNALQPQVTVITKIGMDHMELLGPTLTDIATEKAGIIKPHIPLVTQVQSAEARSVLHAAAIRCDAPWIEVTEPWSTSTLGLIGPHQRWNAALAVTAVDAAKIQTSPDVQQQALATTSWPGRFEVINTKFVLDGAHNEDGIRALVATWREVYGARPAHLIFGCVDGKEVESMTRLLLPIVSEWHLPVFQSPRAVHPSKLRDLLIKIDPKCQAVCHDSVGEALQVTSKSENPVLVAGSLFLVGEARALLDTQSSAYQPSFQ